MNNTLCLINQSACGRVAGNPVCPKCGMDERVVYPGQADREVAQAAALARYEASEEAANQPPEIPKPSSSPTAHTAEPPQAPALPYALGTAATTVQQKMGFKLAALGVLVLAVFVGGLWWWKTLDNELVQAREQVKTAQMEAERARGDAASAVAVAAATAAASKPVSNPAPTANTRPAVAGTRAEAAYNRNCAVCHATGVAGAPKFGDKADWAPRVAQGLDGLTASVINGKNAMPPRGGSTASDTEIKAAVGFMLAAVKANLPDPGKGKSQKKSP